MSKEYRPRLSEEEYRALQMLRDGHKQRRMIILPDLHAPFILEGALDECKKYRDKYQITDFACTGDVVDFHKSSFHKSEIDAYNADKELELAIKQLKPWHDEFPNMLISKGNHDDIPIRQFKEAGLSQKLMKPLNEAIECPTWSFKIKQDLGHNTELHHGIGRASHTMAKEEGKNIIMGHKHSKTYITQNYYKLYGMLFSMQLGALFNPESYAARYSRGGASSIPSIGFLFENDDYWIPFFKVLEL